MSLSNHIEATLFLSGEPMSFKKLAELLDKEEDEIKASAKELKKNLQNRGVVLVENDDKITLATSPESSNYCEQILKEELNKNISKAALETLAIILYKGIEKENENIASKGVSKMDIDYIRGVNSAFSLRNLLIRGLVERKISKEAKGAYAYMPSAQLLQFLGITKKEDLPDFKKFKKQLKDNLSDLALTKDK